MVYKGKEEVGETGELLHQGFKDGYKILIINLGSHPCGYVGVPETHILNGVSYSTLNDDEIFWNCNGGFSYSDKGVNGKSKRFWFFGWDYSHAGDYYHPISHIERYGASTSDKKWTTEEIYHEAVAVIEQLKCVKKGLKTEDKYHIENEK